MRSFDHIFGTMKQNRIILLHYDRLGFVVASVSLSTLVLDDLECKQSRLSSLQDARLLFLSATLQLLRRVLACVWSVVGNVHHTRSALWLVEATSLYQEMIMWHCGGGEKKEEKDFFHLITVIVFQHLCFICTFLGDSLAWPERFSGFSSMSIQSAAFCCGKVLFWQILVCSNFTQHFLFSKKLDLSI